MSCNGPATYIVLAESLSDTLDVALKGFTCRLHLAEWDGPYAPNVGITAPSFGLLN